MKTKSKSKTYHELPAASEATIPVGRTGRVIFFGPPETIDKLTGGQDIGQPVTRQEVKDLAIEYVHRVTTPYFLDPIKEPITLLISKKELEALLSTNGCEGLVAMLAVETKKDYYEPHQTFVLMPCDAHGIVIKSNGPQTGVERWTIGRNIESIIEDGGIVSGVEKFLTEDLHI